MSDVHDLALAFADLAQTVSDETGKLNAQGLQPDDDGYDDWMTDLAKLNTLYDQLSDAATKLDSAYAAQRLTGLQSNLTAITSATNDANQAIKTIAEINDVLHLVAAAAAAGAAIVATIANPVVGGSSLIASAQALDAAVEAFKKDNK